MSEMNTAPEVTSTPAPQAAPEGSPAPQAASPAPEASPSPQAAPVVGADGAPAAPAWTPNFKVKSYDKEYEIDEMFRPLIKDAETEKKVRAIFEKAYGLEGMKPLHTKAKEELDKLRPVAKEHETLKTQLSRLSEMYNQGDHENFFKAIGVSDQVLMNYVMKRLEYMDLTPDKRAEYDRMVASRGEQYELAHQYQGLEQQFHEMQTQIRGQELRATLSQPDVKAVADRYDAAVGQGSFVQEVINQGLLTHRTTGKDLSVEEAVQLVLKRVQPLLGAVQPVQPPQAAQPVVQQKPAVIPNISGASTSPVRQKPKTTDDLRRLAQEMSR